MKNKSINELISAFESQYNEKTSFVNIDFITKTKEDIDFILSNPNVFFCASKSRIIMVHWICEKIRKIYEKTEYSSQDLSNEVYEELRNFFNTKAFNRLEFLKLFGCDKKPILSYNEFIKKEQFFIQEYNNIVFSENALSCIHHIFLIEEEFSDLSSEINALLKNNRQEEVLYKRSQGETLDTIGEELNITRERARQIEIKPKALIERWLENKKDELLKNFSKNIMINENLAIEYFGEKKWEILKYTADLHKGKFTNWFLIKELNTLVYSPSNKFYEDILSAISVSEKKELSISELLLKLSSDGYDFLTQEDIVKFCKNSKYNIYKDKIFPGKLNIGKSILIAAEKDFSEGIDIHDKTSFKNFADYLNKNYGQDVKPNRALIARIQDVLIMSDNSIYKSPLYIKKTKNLNVIIKEYMNKLNDDRTTYQKMYNDLDKKILTDSGINNYSSLHGYIKKNETELNLISLRYYICKKETEELQSKGFFSKFANFLLEKKVPVEINEILSNFDGWSEMYLKYSMLYFSEIVQWSKNTYFNLALIKITQEEQNKIEKIIKKSLSNKIKYTNIYIIYSKIKENMPLFLKNNNIKDENQLFHVLKYVFLEKNEDKKYQFIKPHILFSNNKKTAFTTDDLLLSLIGNNDSFNKNQIIQELYLYYGGKNSSLTLAVQKIIKDYIRIDANKYFKKSKISFSEKEIIEIEEFINCNLIDNKYLIPNKITDFSNLPTAPFEWSSWALCEIIKMYDLPFTILNKRNNIMQNTMVIITQNSKIKTKEELLKEIFEKNYKGDFSSSDVFKFIKNIGMFSSNFILKDVEEIINIEYKN